MARILTGIQSSGRPHLGNILGAIVPAIELSRNPDNESFFFIADLHSLVSIKDGKLRHEYARAIAATWIAFGFDFEKNVFWRQSRIQEHTELAWYLNCFTPFPMLANATSFKEKSEKLADVNAGLFTYPVLQAADILLYNANIIPVGKDQKQHLEMTKDIATRFNQIAGEEMLVLPEPQIDERIMTIPGVDGQKMSKSYHNYIDIFVPENELKKSIKKIVSDSTPLEEPKDPETDITFKLYSLIASESDVATMRQNYLNGGYGYGHAKQALLECMLEKFAEPRRIFNYYMENEQELEAILVAGETKARAIAQETIAKVRKVLGFSS
ncbi:tryptophan--tRNA ligase [Dyadobacter chenhuakuii]|uniref:Tryptophan--tRNA ligase n=1 Tax=Dyadobacter chenhuakuii TaxID=2909339 RepID=A0ABY4XNZ0_9BACT|nr:tryptophan--tRNA ligase [Dyadobacter chenhuakuii]MCF2494540.1 tryptophan--tRNA ligase [Dyadobacter chenhuakuii]USJ32137.1 tryptophan--tRNA ligase [Dyadobacter chenhuakuii]